MPTTVKRIITWTVAAVVVTGGGLFVHRSYSSTGEEKVTYRTQAVERGRVVTTVTATGTLSPLNTVQVGSQVSGRILELYADFNSEVKKGQVIARIDPSIFASNVAKARANLKSGQANVNRAQAMLEDARKKHQRARALAAEKLLSAAEVESAEATYKSALAQEVSARAELAQSKAALEQAKVNLEYTTIVSPIDGTVISRDVDVGQTVAASLQAPTLFTIAEDLRKMELHTSVAESDVGKLAPEMSVTFDVDAYPDETFRGVVRQIRNAPQTVQNVVTYDAVVRVENDQLKLRPGMTANVTFIVARKRNALVVPNAALRFSPPERALVGLSAQERALIAPAGKRARRGERGGSDRPADKRPGDRSATSAASPDDESKAGSNRDSRGGGDNGRRPRRDPSQRIVWVMEGDRPRPTRVTIGISDGTATEIASGDLREGATLITGMNGNPPAARKPPQGRGRRGRFL